MWDGIENKGKYAQPGGEINIDEGGVSGNAYSRLRRNSRYVFDQ